MSMPDCNLLPKVYLALLHHPVKNKNGETIVSAVTNLDLHDIARAAATYGIRAFYVVTPLTDQQSLVKKIISHWTNGSGGIYNPKRKQALNGIRLAQDLDQVIEDIRADGPENIKIVATCAAGKDRTLGFETLRGLVNTSEDTFLIVLGTAWGLTDEFMDSVDFVLEPIRGRADYNHLSVRSAAAIVLDRVLGCRPSI